MSPRPFSNSITQPRTVLVVVGTLESKEVRVGWWATQHLLRGGDSVEFLLVEPEGARGRCSAEQAAQQYQVMDSNLRRLVQPVVQYCAQHQIKTRARVETGHDQTVLSVASQCGASMIVFGAAYVLRSGLGEYLVRNCRNFSFFQVQDLDLRSINSTRPRHYAIGVDIPHHTKLRTSTLWRIWTYMAATVFKEGDQVTFIHVGAGDEEANLRRRVRTTVESPMVGCLVQVSTKVVLVPALKKRATRLVQTLQSLQVDAVALGSKAESVAHAVKHMHFVAKQRFTDKILTRAACSVLVVNPPR